MQAAAGHHAQPSSHQLAQQRLRVEARLKELNTKASQLYEQRRRTEHWLPDGGAQVRVLRCSSVCSLLFDRLAVNGGEWHSCPDCNRVGSLPVYRNV
jgi:hypothetical protein